MSMEKVGLTYLTMDSLQEGVGASQVLSYIKKLSDDCEITLVSFEKFEPTMSLKTELQSNNITWKPLAFGRFGPVGAISRLIRLWKLTPSHSPVHARGDLVALVCCLKLNRRFLWDCRALMSDQRSSLDNSKYKAPNFLLLRLIERVVAHRSAKINVLTKVAKLELMSRYGLPDTKFSILPTCVDLEKFRMTRIPDLKVINILISGTVSAAYDIELMSLIILELKKSVKVNVTIALSMGHTNKWQELYFDDVVRLEFSEMPKAVADSTIGFAIWKNNLGVALKGVSSTKVAEFLATGRPVVVNSLQGDIGDIVSKFRVGLATNGRSPEDIASYAKEILKLISNPRIELNCRDVAEKFYNLDSAVSELKGIYSLLAR